MKMKSVFDDLKCLLKINLFQAILSMFIVVGCLKLIRPVVQRYFLARNLERLAGNPKLHWFYGHMTKIGKSPHDVIMTLANLFSENPIMYNLWRGPLMSTLHLYHPQAVRSLLSSSSPKDWLLSKFLRPWLGDGLLISNGSKWKRHRTLLTNAFHFQILKFYMQVSNQTVRVLIEKWKTKNNGPLEISNDISLMTLDTMVQCAMSTKTDCQSTEEKHFYVEAIEKITKSISRRIQRPLHFIDWIYRLTKAGGEFYDNVKITQSYSKQIINGRRKELERIGACDRREERGSKRVDFIDILLCAKDEDGTGLTDQEIGDEVETFMFEGHDTTASGLSWALYNLARFPEFQEKCRNEILFVCQSDDDIKWEDLNKLHYVTMFLKESLRLFPPVIMASRCLDKPIKIKPNLDSKQEVEIPAGSTVNVNMIALHRNPLLWKQPEEFLPDRFNKENSSNRSPHAYLPFSAGSRNCIGQNFAMNEMKVCLSQILRNFRLYLDEETPTPKFDSRLILQAENGIYIKLKEI